MTTLKGQCLCGDVQFETGMPQHLDVCHCNMCRRWNGGPYIGADFRNGIRMIKDDSLRWYESSEWAKRGFCNICGTSLFYCLKEDKNFWSISAGALDLPAGMELSKEIFIDEKPDYYCLAGERPRLTGEQAIAAFMSAVEP